MLNVKVWTWALAVWGAVVFVVCVLWGFVAPDTGLHNSLLEAAFPGFRWLTPGGFVIGLVESFVYGAGAGLLFSSLHNKLYRRWEPSA
jgi:hypothetical protein